jgi:hypothetical protein
MVVCETLDQIVRFTWAVFELVYCNLAMDGESAVLMWLLASPTVRGSENSAEKSVIDARSGKLPSFEKIYVRAPVVGCTTAEKSVVDARTGKLPSFEKYMFEHWWLCAIQQKNQSSMLGQANCRLLKKYTSEHRWLVVQLQKNQSSMLEQANCRLSKNICSSIDGCVQFSRKISRRCSNRQIAAFRKILCSSTGGWKFFWWITGRNEFSLQFYYGSSRCCVALASKLSLRYNAVTGENARSYE